LPKASYSDAERLDQRQRKKRGDAEIGGGGIRVQEMKLKELVAGEGAQ